MELNKEDEQILREFVRSRIEIFEGDEPDGCHWNDTTDSGGYKYRGFNMSGYGTDEKSCLLENAELLNRFSDIFLTTDNRRIQPLAVTAWKGSLFIHWCPYGGIVNGKLPPFSGFSEVEERGSGETTEDILVDILRRLVPGYTKSKIYEIKMDRTEIEKDIDLSDLKDEDREKVKTKIINRFQRDMCLVKTLKEKHDKCQLCSYTFKKKNGENYNEIHHVIPISENGKDKEINTLVVCANCHRKLHYANVSLGGFPKTIEINKEKVEIRR